MWVIDCAQTHDNVHSLVKVDHLSFIINNGNSTNSQLREHVHDVKDSGLKRGSRNGVERVLRCWVLDVGADAQLLDTSCQVLGDITALRSSAWAPETPTHVHGNKLEHSVLRQDTDHHLTIRLGVLVYQGETSGMRLNQELAGIE